MATNHIDIMVKADWFFECLIHRHLLRCLSLHTHTHVMSSCYDPILSQRLLTSWLTPHFFPCFFFLICCHGNTSDPPPVLPSHLYLSCPSAAFSTVFKESYAPLPLYSLRYVVTSFLFWNDGSDLSFLFICCGWEQNKYLLIWVQSQYLQLFQKSYRQWKKKQKSDSVFMEVEQGWLW